MKRCGVSFDEVVSLENLCEAWQEFIRGKRKKKDVLEFQFRLADEIVALHGDLVNGTYHHGPYYEFRINDPKPRVIHKALVRDRLLHHAIHRMLYSFFESTFVVDSFSCQKGKGVHRALVRFRSHTRKTSKNHSKTCWILKCDIRKFFTSIDHFVLADLLERQITNKRLLGLLYEIIDSFHVRLGKGIPLGNLTSQLFANIYMNPFDHYVKHRIKHKHYVRYADDFVFLSPDRSELVHVLEDSRVFLSDHLALDVHPDKVFLKTAASGMDFLGWVHFPQHLVLRTKTKKRILKRGREHPTEETLQSYFGMLGHGNGHHLRVDLENIGWLYGDGFPLSRE